MNKPLIVLGLMLGVFGAMLPASAIKLNCPWQCTANSGNDNNILWDYTDEICSEAFTTAANEVGAMVPNGQRYYAGQAFRDTWMGTGWTAWWHLILDYCVDRGLWINATRNGAWPGQLTYGDPNTVTFQVPSAPELDVEELDLDGCNEGRVCLRGRTFTGVTRTMNSPFIYFDNVPDGDYRVRLNSDSQFTTDPDFNAENGWDVVVDGEWLMVNGEKEKHLFYELETPSITLSRNGKNFSDAQALFEYLTESEFFERLGLNETQKQNSLAYVLENLPQKSHYYLTILEDLSIDEISDLEIKNQAGENMSVQQKYFAIYPTRVPVRIEGDLVFPTSQDAPIKEYGEVIIKPHMHVFWK